MSLMEKESFFAPFSLKEHPTLAKLNKLSRIRYFRNHLVIAISDNTYPLLPTTLSTEIVGNFHFGNNSSS